VLREILRLRKQDEDEGDEQESPLDLYLKAMESGFIASTGSVEDPTGGASMVRRPGSASAQLLPAGRR
jgi:hypothetical protein